MKITTGFLALLVLAAGGIATAGDIGFSEDFALATDRTRALKQLIPGTEDYYFYHALHYQNTEQYEKVEQILKPWINRYKYTPRVHEIINRQALLTFQQTPEKTLARLRERLGLRFDHQRELLDRKPNLPTQLDQAMISRETLLKRAFARHKNLAGFEPGALDWLITTELNPDQRRHLLSMLKRPDHVSLAQLVVADLNHSHSRGFGYLGIHRQLLLRQLNECLKLKPALLNQGNFVNTYLTKLHPNPDVDWRNDLAAYEAHLDRLWAFVKKLAPVHNSLKAHVLYQRLVHDRSQGIYDADRFLAYIRLPRPMGYVEPKYLQLEESRRHQCNLNATFQEFTLLPPVGNDEALVRSYLTHFFVEAANYDAYTPFIRDEYLKHLFAETKIVRGLGDPEQWYSMLPPAAYQALKERVDLDFAFTNKARFAPDDPISLDVHVKNVKTLIVKVFEINTGNYYRTRQLELDTDINLDGLVANEENTHTYKDPPLRRIRRHFEFPELNKRGAYVIDFIGNGKSSRALVRKGKLHYLVRTSTAGQVFTVFDEHNRHLPDASLWLAGHEYRADKQGVIAVPFTSKPRRQPIVLTHGTFSCLDAFQSQAENYQLQAGIFVDRESLLRLQTARVLVRPSLRINGVPVTLSVLEEVKLRITSTDLDGVSSSTELPDFQLQEDQEATHDFQVPQRLASISFRLQAKVQNLSKNTKVDLAVEQTFTVNQIDRTEKVEDLHFSKVAGRYLVDVLGKSGERLPDRPVQFRFKHRDFRDPIDVSLQTDADGRVILGPLADISQVTATGPEGTAHTWQLGDDAYSYHRLVQGRAGEDLLLPYMGDAAVPQREELSLLEVRGPTFVADRFKALGIKDGFLVVKNLPRGDYDLLIKRSGTRIRLRLAEGDVFNRHVLGQHRYLQTRSSAPVQIQSINTDREGVTVQLAGATKFTRLHVFAVRYQPAFSAFGFLGRVRDMEPSWRILPSQRTTYVAGRNIGDEFRYIIDRKYAQKFPGNMLNRPSLLLNPWPIRTTETTTRDALGGESFGGGGGGFGGMGGNNDAADRKSVATADFANLDFLGQGSAVLVNLKPDEKGVVRIDRELIGPHQHLHLVAIDPLGTTFREISLPEVPRVVEDLRLIAGLDPQAHFIKQKQISIVASNQKFEIPDIASSDFELYESLPRVYGLYMTLSGDAKLAEFSFIMNWHKLEADEQRDLYSEYACHELNFFLMKKDPDFFRQVVVPYVNNKKDKTFLDRWLLGDNVDEYLLPWHHGQLNIVEQILLARRIKGESSRTARFVTDRFNMIPPDVDRYSFLFKTALQGRALESGDYLGLKDAKEQAQQAARGEALEKSKMRDLAAGPQSERVPLAPAEEPAAGDAAATPDATGEAHDRPHDKENNQKLSELKKKIHEGSGREGKDEEVEEELEELADAFFDDDMDRRRNARQFYRKLDQTQEWVENNYYRLPIEQQNAELVQVNSFWNDFAAHDGKKPFYSSHLGSASRSFTEMMFALSVLDLPMEGKDPKTEVDGTRLTLTAESPLVVFHEEILPSKKMAEQTPILVSQNFFRHGDRYRFEGNQRLDKYVTAEFLVHTVYGCQVVVTNPTSAQRKLDLLLQIPVGAMPVLNGRQTKSVQLDLQPYQTRSVEYHFYFPAPGEFAHYPVQVSQDEELLAYAEPFTLNVVRQLSKIDRGSWDYISQHGTPQDVIKFLQTNNINRINLDRIAWRMKEQDFFRQVVGLLTQRHVYNHTLWSYGILHGSVPAIREYLQSANAFVQQCGDWLTSPLLAIDPVLRRSYQHMDYRPLVNARAHQLGRRRQILNDRFYEQYQRLMDILCYKRELDDEDLMSVTYYLLLQDRIAEALDFFDRVNAERLPTRLQHDYFTAYLNYYRSEPQLAAAIAAKYETYPVVRWRQAFETVTSQWKEIEGADVAVIDDEDREQKQVKLAATAATFDFRVESRKVVLNYQNLSAVHVNYYLMDIELLFSSNPFVQEYGGRFSFIRPNLSQSVELDEGGDTTTFNLPGEFHNKNVLVEITGGGQTKSKAYYANSLNLQLVENYGQLQVTMAEERKPLSTVYVKVYARLKDGRVRFYKDGYTDLRGRFDYTSLNTNELEFVDKFALLVLSEQHGAIVREARPPQR